MHPIEPGMPGTLGPGTVLVTLGGGSIRTTAAGEVMALLVQLDALTYQIKAKLQTLPPNELSIMKSAMKVIADNLYAMVSL